MTDDSAHYVITLMFITDSNDCEAFASGMTGTATASIYKIPETIITTASQVVCDSVVTLTADKDVGLGTWSVIEGDDNMVFTDPNEANTIAVTIFGDRDSLFYKILWTEQNWECISRDSLEIVFLKQPDPAFAGNDSTVFFADTVRLFAAPATAGVGVWTLEAGDAVIDNPYDPASFIDLGSDDLDEPRDYAFRWTITNGICTTVDDDVILSRRDIRRYGGFSPDGNEKNDYYVIRGLDYADSWEITFYSRHGNQLRKISSDQAVPEDQLWDGKLENGMDVEDGTYYYILIVTKGNRNYEYKGTVELARERL
jgi:gliding motility-associated-like protein